MTFLITGGAGFIGSQFVRLCAERNIQTYVLDSLTYAGCRENLPHEAKLIEGTICDSQRLASLFFYVQPHAVFNFAAESHVDRSIADADRFIESNVRGTYVLLRESLKYWQTKKQPKEFRYVQISTDEVYGDLGSNDSPFTEDSHIRPHSPYAASKAAADHFCSVFHHTYGLPVLVTRCSNNYGPRQYPEKLIPAAVSAFLAGRPFGLHGSGENVRDWISVEDHCRGILATWESGTPGESYLFGGASERTNREVVEQIRSQLGFGTVELTADRPGNDRRYAVDFSRATKELGWFPADRFEPALHRTVKWYLKNEDWIRMMLARSAA